MPETHEADAYSGTARYYDALYAFKDYAAESSRLIELIAEELGETGGSLLDVACGTGQHLAHLKTHFAVEGLDLSSDLLEIAGTRNPEVRLHLGDMTDFDLGRAYTVVTCLFSSIGYVKTLDHLCRAARCLAHHVAAGGLLLVEPWFTPDAWHPGTVHALLVDEPDLKIARVNTSFVKGRISYFDLHHLIGTPEGTRHVVEHHELGLFEKKEMEDALSAAGLAVRYDCQGLTGRGLYIARKC